MIFMLLDNRDYHYSVGPFADRNRNFEFFIRDSLWAEDKIDSIGCLICYCNFPLWGDNFHLRTSGFYGVQVRHCQEDCDKEFRAED